MRSLSVFAIAAATLIPRQQDRGAAVIEHLGIQSAACGGFRPRILSTPDGYAAYLEEPQALRSEQGSFILGSPGFAASNNGEYYRTADSLRSRFIVGARLSSQGRVLLLPSPTAGTLAHPRGVIDPAGRLHLVWVDGDSLNNPLHDQPVKTARWLGASWSTPSEVEGTAAVVFWRQNGVSPPVMIGSSLVLVSTIGVMPWRTRALTLSGDRWIGHSMPALHQSYLSLAVATDTLVAVYVDWGAPDGNSVFASRSGDGGKSFLAPVRLSAPGSGHATDARVVRLKDGRLVAIWVAAKTASESALNSAYSRDGGRTWIDGGSISPGTTIISMRADVARSNKVVVLAQIGTRRGVVPTYIEWRDRWSTPLPLTHDSSAIGIPAIAADDSVLMAWGEFPPGARRPVTKYVVLPGDCRPPM